MWVFVGAAGFVASIITASMLLGGSTWPLAVQIPLGIATMVPWMPGLRQRLSSPTFFICSTVPTLILTWSGGSPLLFGVLALGASRVAVSTTLPRTGLYALSGIAMVLGRQWLGHHNTDWFMWKTYVELGAVAGVALQRQRLLVMQTKAASSEHARLAALDERRRIARDVHDVLAHTLTILMMHVNSARLQVYDDPDGTAEVLNDVAQYGRQALDEIRRTVGLLSEPPQIEHAAGPIETANAIENLVASYRKARIDVDLRLDVEMAHMGLLASTPVEVWASGYRIVQESLANAAKHASGTSIELWIGVDDTGLHLTCTNPLHASVVPLELPKGGNGVTGMRERVDHVQGSFSAGVEGKSWVVRADLPLSKVAVETQTTKLGRAS